MVDMSAHTVRATRWSGGWELHIGDVGVTQSRTLATAERQVRGYLGALLDADVSDVTVTIAPELGDLTERVALARAHAADAARAQRDAAAESHILVREMRAAGLSLTDIAAIMHVSTGRIAQLALPGARAILGNLE